MPSLSISAFNQAFIGVNVLRSFAACPSPVTNDQPFIDETCRKATIAMAVGCWEGYVESVVREFIAKVRLQTHRRNWSLFGQFEVIVDAKIEKLNTPNWDVVRNLIIEVIGLDRFNAWI
jgi:hypothetical protein